MFSIVFISRWSLLSCHGNWMTFLLFVFFKVPRPPEIDMSSCIIGDNNITVAWQPAGDGDGDSFSGPIKCFDLEYQKTNQDIPLKAAGEGCWEKICDITEPQVTISGELMTASVICQLANMSMLTCQLIFT